MLARDQQIGGHRRNHRAAGRVPGRRGGRLHAVVFEERHVGLEQPRESGRNVQIEVKERMHEVIATPRPQPVFRPTKRFDSDMIMPMKPPMTTARTVNWGMLSPWYAVWYQSVRSPPASSSSQDSVSREYCRGLRSCESPQRVGRRELPEQAVGESEPEFIDPIIALFSGIRMAMILAGDHLVQPDVRTDGRGRPDSARGRVQTGAIRVGKPFNIGAIYR